MRVSVRMANALDTPHNTPLDGSDGLALRVLNSHSCQIRPISFGPLVLSALWREDKFFRVFLFFRQELQESKLSILVDFFAMGHI